MKNCIKSPNKKHEFVYPRYEDSIDAIRTNESYCKYCFRKENILLENTRIIEKAKEPCLDHWLEKVNYTALFEEDLLQLLEEGFGGTAHCRLLDRLLKLNGFSKESCRLLFTKYPQEIYWHMLNNRVLSAKELLPYLEFMISSDGNKNNIYFYSWVAHCIQCYLKRYSEELDEKTVLELSNRQLQAQQADALIEKPICYGNSNSGLYH